MFSPVTWPPRLAATPRTAAAAWSTEVTAMSRVAVRTTFWVSVACGACCPRRAGPLGNRQNCPRARAAGGARLGRLAAGDEHPPRASVAQHDSCAGRRASVGTGMSTWEPPTLAGLSRWEGLTRPEGSLLVGLDPVSVARPRLVSTLAAFVDLASVHLAWSGALWDRRAAGPGLVRGQGAVAGGRGHGFRPRLDVRPPRVGRNGRRALGRVDAVARGGRSGDLPDPRRHVRRFTELPPPRRALPGRAGPRDGFRRAACCSAWGWAATSTRGCSARR